MHVFSTLVSLSVASMALAGPVAQRSSPLGRRGGKAPVYYNSQGTGAFGTASFDDNDKFLVILQETDFMTEGVDETVQHYAGKASSSFNGTVEGFSGRLDSVAIEKLRNSNRVSFKWLVGSWYPYPGLEE